jgi:hypothetical protein
VVVGAVGVVVGEVGVLVSMLPPSRPVGVAAGEVGAGSAPGALVSMPPLVQAPVGASAGEVGAAAGEAAAGGDRGAYPYLSTLERRAMPKGSTG